MCVVLVEHYLVGRACLTVVPACLLLPAQGIPDGLSDCKLCEKNCDGCQTTTFVQAFDDTSKGYDMLGYTRVHRDAAIVAAMQQWMHIG